MSRSSSSSDALVAQSARGASYLMGVVAAQRLLTFGLNALLIRSVSPSLLGFAHSDMELLTATILFLSREAARLVALRAPLGILGYGTRGQRGGDMARQQLVNLAWLPVPLGVSLAVAAAMLFASSGSNAGGKASGGSISGIADQTAGIMLYCLASLVETLAEPAYILCQATLLTAARARTEVAATLVKCVVTYVLAAHVQLGARSFALGQLSYAAVLALGFWGHLLVHTAQQQLNSSSNYKESGHASSRGASQLAAGDLLAAASVLVPRVLQSSPSSSSPSYSVRVGNGPLKVHDESAFDALFAAPAAVLARLQSWLAAQLGPSQLQLLLAFSGQSVVKHLLTEGDRIVLTAVSTQEQRGVYAVVQNYGSLVVRLMFQPLEESTRTLMSKLLLTDATHSGSSRSSGRKDKDDEGPFGASTSSSAYANVGQLEAGGAVTPSPASRSGSYVRKRTTDGGGAGQRSVSARRRRPSINIDTPSSLADVPLDSPPAASISGSSAATAAGVVTRRGRSASRGASRRGKSLQHGGGGVGGGGFHTSSPSVGSPSAASLTGAAASASAFTASDVTRTAVGVYTSVLALVITAGLTFAAFGPPLSPLVVATLLGSRWSGTAVPPALAAYCLYIVTLAVNGVTEAFATAAAGPSELHRYNVAMAGASAAYALLAALLLPRVGIPGLIGASGLNMALRIGVCWAFLAQYTRRRGHPLRLAPALPSPQSLACYAGSLGGLIILRTLLGGPTGLADVRSWALIAGACAAVGGTGASLWTWDRRRLRDAWATVRGKKAA